MSYRFLALAVDAAISEQTVVTELFALFRELASELSLPIVYARFAPEAIAKDCGLRLFVLETRGGDRLLHRGPILDRLGQVRATTAFGYDDQQGIYAYELRAPGRAARALSSVGPILRGDLDPIDVPYPQRGFTEERLTALSTAPAETLNLSERAAVYDWWGAVDIALRAYHPAAQRAHLRAPLASDSAWLLFEPGKGMKRPATRKAPKDLRPLVEHGVDDAPKIELSTEVVVPCADMDSRTLTDAINRLNRSIALTHAGDAWSHCMRARAHAMNGEVEPVIADARRAVGLDSASRRALCSDAEIMRFAHVPELRELLELPAPETPTWPSRLKVGWGTLGFVCPEQLRARPQWPANMVRIGSRIEPTGYSFHGEGSRARSDTCAWVALEQRSGEVIVAHPDGSEERRIGGDIQGGVRPMKFQPDGRLVLQLRSARHEARIAAPPEWTPRTAAEAGHEIWFERGTVVETGNPTKYEWTLRRAGSDPASALWKTVTYEIAPPVRTSRGWLWIVPRPPKCHSMLTFESGEVQERFELPGGLAKISDVRGDDVLLFHGGSFSRYDASKGTLTLLLAGPWAHYQWPRWSPSGRVLACLEKIRDGLARLVIVTEPERPVRLPVEGVRSFEWVDETALVVSDAAGRVRLVSTDPGEAVVELGDGHLF